MSVSLYVLVHPTTQEWRYVGQSTNPARRLIKHRHDAKFNGSSHRRDLYVYRWWNKCVRETGEEPEMRIVDVVSSVEQANLREKEIISGARQRGVPLTNLTDGGYGASCTEETRRKISESKKGKRLGPFSKERRENMSKAQRGHVVPVTVREKISYALTGQLLSEETKAKISAAKRGVPHSEATRQKQSEAVKRWWADRALRPLQDSLGRFSPKEPL